MNDNIKFLLQSLFIVLLVIPFHTSADPDFDEKTSPKNPNSYLCKSYLALVVGVSNYEYWPVLPNAVGNANDVARILKQAGFSVTLKIDPTTQELNTALQELKNKGQEPDQGILFYYTGLGETQILTDGTQLGYIIPKDCPSLQNDPAGFKNKAVSMRNIVSLSMEITSKHVLMLFDSSFSGDVFSLENPSLKILGKDSVLPMRQFIIAGKADEPVPDKSIFKKFLLKGLKGHADLIYDGYITGTELGVYLSNSVVKATKEQQHPQYGLIKNPSLRQGDFIFKPIQAGPDTGHLFVKTNPQNAQIRILNIKPRFRNGIELESGKYHIEVSAKNYGTKNEWIDLEAGEKKTVEFQLHKIESVYINKLGMKFIYIKPGTFTMGSPLGKYRTSDDEKAHKVTLTRGFYMQATEVTVNQFRQFVQSTGYKTEGEKQGGCWIKSSGMGWKKKKGSKWNKPDSWETKDLPLKGIYPVTCVSWNDASAFISWLSKREKQTYAFPTEAEWEYACRAETTTPFAFGKCLRTNQANFNNAGSEFPDCQGNPKPAGLKPVPVGSLAPNTWGLYDMHGNVAEWCGDQYGGYPKGPVKNPQGPSVGAEKVIRGGHWFVSAEGCRSAKRGAFRQNAASDVIGFRVVMRP